MSDLRQRIVRGLTCALATLSIAGITCAAELNVGASSIIATFKQEDVPVDAPFKTFSGKIDFSAANPAAGKATLQVATASLDLGSADYNAEVQKPDWFNCAAYPNATFVSTSITAAAPGHLTATGTFTLKGRSETISIPVTVTTSGGATAYDGKLQISRKYFSIGSPTWSQVVDDTVQVRFHLVQ